MSRYKRSAAGIKVARLQLKEIVKASGSITKKQLKDLFEDYKKQQAADSYLSEVKKLIALPEAENPTVAIISDVEKMRQTNPFFSKAQNGNVLILYSTKAILYDPVKKIIIDVAPVNVAGNSASPQASAVASVTPVPTPTRAPTPAIRKVASPQPTPLVSEAPQASQSAQ